ncbi:SLATT domain-containing protein [Methylococcus capsulatus]|uniref:SLATT domain-containing protein n=1 Tax=Methylococcus capsulatus TaxID=414 RepID=UPI001C528885|nr:SLATT domain-containing protein [Methylococcus capsulatus]QXP87470.1 SLATT domain-containing protein [Methylococcus capsulatus]QXP92792.1 SLATT domain-containing protein [Methylococcus capsulatus]UQN12478.1 SLATT domain-containing protein [Methylococcus capsulatus]
MNELTSRLAAEAERIEEDTEHSFKGHYNAAARWARYHLLIGLPSALLAAVAGAAAFKDQPEWAGALALLSTAMTTVLTFLKPSERAEMHKTVAGQYQALRNQARLFREIGLTDGLSAEEAKARLFELAKTRDELNQSSPAIARCDYELAKKDIDSGRARYRVDEVKS